MVAQSGMVARSQWSGAVGFALLAGALVSSPTSFAVEADTEAPRAPTAESTLYHTVAPGETLTAIAQQYRISIASLVRANEIADAQMIRAGTRLRIPASPEPAATRAVGAVAAGAKLAHDAAGSDPLGVLLERCEAEVRAARFEQALATAAELRARLDARPDASDAAHRVRLEVASATAYVALEQRDAALGALERALAADPGLELDPAQTSPKVLAVFRAARSQAATSP